MTNPINVTYVRQINYPFHLPASTSCRLLLYIGDGCINHIPFRRALAALVMPEQAFSLIPDTVSGYIGILNFPPEHLSELRLPGNHANPILSADPPDTYVAFATAALTLIEQHADQASARHTVLSLTSWFLLLALHLPEPEPSISHSQLLVDQAKEIIHRDYASDLTLQTVASQLFVNPCYLSTVFHQVTGSTFRAYLKNVRLQHTCRLLTETNHLITDIAMQTGFNSTAYLISSFRKEFGMTPNVYRSRNIRT